MGEVHAISSASYAVNRFLSTELRGPYICCVRKLLSIHTIQEGQRGELHSIDDAPTDVRNLCQYILFKRVREANYSNSTPRQQETVE